MNIKLRPTILILSGGMVAALIIICIGIVAAVRATVSEPLLTALIVFGGTIVTGLVALATKLVESEEVSDKPPTP